MSDHDSREFCWPVRVYYEDTDAGGIVYHANYLKFMERARTEWLRQLGYEQTDLASSYGILFVVKRIAIDYAAPAYFNDELLVVSSVQRLGRASIEFEQKIANSDKLFARSQVKLGCVDVNSVRPRSIPSEVYMGIRDAGG